MIKQEIIGNGLKQNWKKKGASWLVILTNWKWNHPRMEKDIWPILLDTEGIFRLIESVPSQKAEPFKLWLASLGKERINEIFDPEIAINRAIDYI